MRKHICIISFSPIRRDARVLRQIEYLSPDYDLTVIGYGDPAPSWQHVVWKPVLAQGSAVSGILTVLFLLLGRIYAPFYDLWYWQRVRNREAYRYTVEYIFDAIHANDLSALPIAVRAARRTQTRVIFDAHEYAPLELENYWWWRLLFSPMTEYMLRKYTPSIQAAMTVCEPIAERYEKEYGFAPICVLNVPKLSPLPAKSQAINPDRIRLIHHGGAKRDRHLEKMIETLSLTDRRFSLDFMLVDSPGYVDELKALAAKLVPGRVTFRDPVPASEVVLAISQYDMGFYLLHPSSYNNLVALPNKFFDFIGAGLAVCIGPSPAMAGLVRETGLGCIAPSFEPPDVARTLNQLTVEQIGAMQQAAREATKRFNADHEMQKVVSLYHHLLDQSVD